MPNIWVATALGGELAKNSEKSFDVLTNNGQKLQVKVRVVSDPVRPSQLQLGVFRSVGFDYAVIVLLSAVDYSVVRASKVPRHVMIESAGKHREHVNGNVLFARPDIMGHCDATDLTATLRAAQTQRQPPASRTAAEQRGPPGIAPRRSRGRTALPCPARAARTDRGPGHSGGTGCAATRPDRRRGWSRRSPSACSLSRYASYLFGPGVPGRQ
jgi:hypothetical protein